MSTHSTIAEDNARTGRFGRLGAFVRAVLRLALAIVLAVIILAVLFTILSIILIRYHIV